MSRQPRSMLEPTDDMPVKEILQFRPTEALSELARKVLMPTRLGTEGLAGVEAWIREQSFFSAKVTDEHFLDLAKAFVDQSMNILTVPGDDGQPVDRALSIPKARLALQDYLDQTSYTPKPGKEGTIEDLRSDARLNLILETNTGLARGKAERIQALEIMDSFPCQELWRLADVEEPRDWPARWAEAGGEFFPGDSDYPEGRMIARVDDPIWSEISAFDYPYPPFDFNSQMGLRSVSSEEALDLGLITQQQYIGKPYTEEEMDLDVSDFTPTMLDMLRDTLPDGFAIEGGRIVQI
jgi:hypothetical protein